MNRSARADRQEVDDWLAKQRICITGGRGALGGHLARRLIPTGAEIVNFDNQSVTSLPDRSEVSSVRHVEGSILHQADLDDALGECQLVFHLAALIHAGDSRANPMRYFETNALGTACVAEACRRLDVGRMIYTSTSHVYGTPRQLPIAEDHPTRPLSV